jgi:hypothetical protein
MCICPLYASVFNLLSQVFLVLHTHRLFKYTEAHAENSTTLPSFAIRIKIVNNIFYFSRTHYKNYN